MHSVIFSFIHSLHYLFIHTFTYSSIPSFQHFNYTTFYSFSSLLLSHAISLTGGESNVESASNIARLSSTLSWLDSFREESDDVTTVITHCARRSLIYPYLRYFIRNVYDAITVVI